ncbi:MAG: hypothetical protein ABJA02_03795 [Acidobacteriota bacterium]
MIDADGTFIEPNQLAALLTNYLSESRGGTLGLARSAATSHLVDRVLSIRGLKIYETLVGFRYIVGSFGEIEKLAGLNAQRDRRTKAKVLTI